MTSLSHPATWVPRSKAFWVGAASALLCGVWLPWQHIQSLHQALASTGGATQNASLLAHSAIVAHAALTLSLLALLARMGRTGAAPQHTGPSAWPVATGGSAGHHPNTTVQTSVAEDERALRTPLQGVLGMLHLLEQSPLNHRQRDHLNTALESALDLLEAMDHALARREMQAGTVTSTPAPFHLCRLLEDVHTQARDRAEDRELTLLLDVAADVPPWVMGDSRRVRQVMRTLLALATHGAQPGSIHIRVRREPGVAGDTVVSMTHDGWGPTSFDGSGTELELAQHLSQAMGGSAQLAPGPTLIARWPLPTTRAPASPQTPTDRQHAGTRALRLLVAEDHPINLKYMGLLLEKMGHDAVFCDHGQQALDLLARQRFDAVLLDLHMPVLDGLATTQAIRSLDSPAAAVPVILVTADALDHTRQRAIKAGVTGFARKPLQERDLERALQECGLMEIAWSPHNTNSPGHTEHTLSETSDATPRRPTLDPMTDMSAHMQTPIDLASYEDILSLMPQEALDDLLQTVFDPPHGTVPELLSALSAGQRQLIGDTAHKLKGTCMLLGFKAMATTSARIEHLALRTDDALPEDLADAIRRDAELTQLALAQYKTQKVG